MDVDREVESLLKHIERLGTPLPEGGFEVAYGTLFRDQQVTDEFEALLGTLKSSKKRGLISFEGQLLLSPTHDHVKIHFAHYNQGSFGSSPKVVLDASDEMRRRWISGPDRFWYTTVEPAFVRAREAVARTVLDCDVDRVTLVDNATTAATIVAQKIAWDVIERAKSGFVGGKPVVLLCNTTYGAVRLAFRAYCERAGAEIVQYVLPFPVYQTADIVEAFHTKLRELKARKADVVIAVFDHIVSETALVLPLRELVGEARAAGVREIFVDGAHAPGQIDLRGLPEELGVDYYTGNLHKWMFCPTACALFYFKAGNDAPLHFPITSHNHGEGFARETWMLATRDYTPLLAARLAVDFYGWIGPERVQKYVRDEAWKAAELLSGMWGTRIGQSRDLAAGMCMIAMPHGIRRFKEPMDLRTLLRDNHNMEVCTPLSVDGTWWLRISVPCWMEAGEFQLLGKVILELSGQERL
ncbi:pyridoxal phosphate-dependent transferase [Hyaloraphidium curvatum]|nr:pyridoxal phosphate-dependent transferase [Hyaloraphidium curvatum]